jgi:hypothetical protein
VSAAPVVSVVLPAYDAQHTVGEAVTSILDQSLREIQVIVVDDGSNDDTVRVLAGIADPRLTVVHHDQNRGHVAAIATALDHARAPLIARMDADDVAFPGRLARQYRLLGARPAVGLVSTAFVSVDPEGRELETHGVPPDHAAAWFRLHFENCLAHPTVMFRRSAYDAAGGYDAAAVPAEDHELWLRMAELVDIATIPEPLLRYRRSPSAISMRAADRATQASVLVAARAIERRVGRRPPERIVEGLRRDVATLSCDDAASVLDAVVPVYVAIRDASAARGLATASLPGQLASVLALGGLRSGDGWCRRGVEGLVRRHPRVALSLAADRVRVLSRGARAALPGGRARVR